MESKEYLSQQILTYMGNKRKLLDNIEAEVVDILKELNQEKAVTCDLFSGSGVVARKLKQYSTKLYANDLESYSSVVNQCYLTNKNDFNEEKYNRYLERILVFPKVEGIITKNYAPKDDNNIQKDERVFYTHENAVTIDTIRTAIDEVIPKSEDKLGRYKNFFLAPLLYEASVHANTSGVFKGFYKSKGENQVGKFGGEAGNALERILGKITLKKPVFSNYDCDAVVYCEDTNKLVTNISGIDIAYLDPPYNQHPYGSNYHMLNTIVKNELTAQISKVAGIPEDWNTSVYNKKNKALHSFDELISNIDAKYVVISYNNEGFITLEEMQDMLSKYGELQTKEIDYVAFRGSRNLRERNIHTTEYLFRLKKFA